MKVAVPSIMSQAGKDYLTSRGFELIETKSQSAAALVKEAADADGIILMTEPFPNTLADQLPKLKVIARHGVGYDNIDPEFWAKRGVWVTIAKNANASTVAESTLAAMMAISKNLVPTTEHLRQGDWGWTFNHLGFDLAGKTLGIVGYGRIGRMIAKKASAFDMKIIAYTPSNRSDGNAEMVDRDTVFKEADIISLNMRVTPETTRSVGQREFDMMKDSAVLLNFGRAALVDQAAMQTALKTGSIAAAAVDVFDQEPLPKDDPWFSTLNVLLTPHCAGNTKECMDRMAVDAASEVVRVLNGEKPLWSVNQPEH